MKSVYLHVNNDADQDAPLQAALDVVRVMSGHLTGLQVNPIGDLMGYDAFGTFAAGEIVEKVTKAEGELAQQLQARLDREAVPWTWIHTNEEPRRAVSLYARLADLIVVARHAGSYRRNSPSPVTGDIVVSASAPVLVVPPELKNFDPSGVAVVGWNGSAQAAQALRAAVPMLRCAAAVQIIEIEERKTDFPATDASVYLSRHGIKSDIQWVERKGRDVGSALLVAAQEIAANYIVMGGYGHSKATEFFMGGTTRHLLIDSPLPLLMAH